MTAVDVERPSQAAALDASNREGSGPRGSTREGARRHERAPAPLRDALDPGFPLDRDL
jgi:hypothetical protein